jgi:hypothetical protein
MTLAELLHEEKDADRALEALRRAAAFARVTGEAADLEQRIHTLSESLGVADGPKPPLDPELMSELGFVDLAAGAVPDRIVSAGVVAGFFAAAADGVRTIALRVESTNPSDGGPGFQLVSVDSRTIGQTTMTGGTDRTVDIDGLGRLRFDVTPIEDGRRFRVTTEVTPPSS